MSHLTQTDYCFFRFLSWCSLTQGWNTNPTGVHEEKMTIPDYCSVVPSLTGLTPTSRPPAQCLCWTAAIKLAKHLSPSGRKYCKPLEVIVPSSDHVFMLISLTAFCRDKYSTFILARSTVRYGTTLSFHPWPYIFWKGESHFQANACFEYKARLMPSSQMGNELYFIASELLKLNWFML